jgi:MYXO-CTERM domain-containing protein
MHNDNLPTDAAEGKLQQVGGLGGDAATHQCPDGNAPGGGTSCSCSVNHCTSCTSTCAVATNNGATEVMHAHPQVVAIGGQVSFQFQYVAPTVASNDCGGFRFGLWVNDENDDLACFANTLDHPNYLSFQIVVSCDDGNGCTNDSCGSTTVPSTCSHVNNAAACTDDGNVCTQDVCSGGACTHTTPAAAGTACHAQGADPTCDPAVTCGGFTSCPTSNTNGLACTDDGNVCTSDLCNASHACTHTTPAPAGTACHAQGADPTCDPAVTCGGNTTCPVSNTNGLTCTSDGNVCTDDVCNAGHACTHTTPAPAGTACHAAGADPACDPAVTCGGNTTCPVSNTTGATCTDDGNICTADLCNAGHTCTHTTPAAAGTVCHAAGADAVCDPTVTCGGNTTCPVSSTNGLTCTSDGNACTSDLCNASHACTHTTPAPASTLCRASSGQPCDVAENCDGVTTTCPPDGVAGTGVQCSGPSCTNTPVPTGTLAQNCNGVAKTCPAPTTVACTGGALCVGNACGGGCGGDDTKCPGGQFCQVDTCLPKRPAGGICVTANYCNAGLFCADGFCCNTACGNSDPTDCQACNVTAGTCLPTPGVTCRAQAGACDVAEVCAGANTACPADAKLTSVCRASTGPCDAPESCDGVNNACPADATTARDGQTCPDDGNVCSSDLCASNACTHTTPAGAAVVCRAAVTAVAPTITCDVAENCPAAGTTCPADAHKAVGTVCRPIQPGSSCDVEEDCTGAATCAADGFKTATTVCSPATCTNGSASAVVDCPGNGATCGTPVVTKCTPFVCNGTACGTTCASNNDCDQTVAYCNTANKCVPKLGPGIACGTNDTACVSGFCTDGVCCNSACTGQCQACDLPAPAKGVCTTVPSGAPHGSRPVCAGDGTACNGSCNGGNPNACFLPDTATTCRPPTCTNGTANVQKQCQGNGSCPAVQLVDCAPGVCGAATGPSATCSDCKVDSQCAGTEYCAGGKCVTKTMAGASCGSDHECASTHCVDKVCCDTACNGQCEACDVAASPGVCTPVTDAPHNGRTACSSDSNFPMCAGKCDGTNRLSCAYPAAGTSCRDASCTNDNATLADFCNGTGSCPPARVQACAPNSCNAAGTLCDSGCLVDNDCAANQYCAGGVCAPKLKNGSSCSDSNQCLGPCVDGVCCNTACDGQCEACDLPANPGTCTAVTGTPHGLRAQCTSDGSTCAGQCNGTLTTACTYPATTVSCFAGTCAAGLATLAANCDGHGSCPKDLTEACSTGTCAGTVCQGNCTTGTCAAGSYCAAGDCKPTLPQGSHCSKAAQCATGNCVDGFCCDVACSGQCQACDVGNTPGTCTTLTGDLPHNGRPGCPGVGACAAICDGSNATACTFASAAVACGASSCSGGIANDTPLCNGAGQCLVPQETSCGSFACDATAGACHTTCAADGDCAPGFQCLGTTCQKPSVDAGVDAGVTDAGLDGSLDGSVEAGDGAAGTAGMSGTAGTAGTSGTAGTAGTGGVAGSSGTGGDTGMPPGAIIAGSHDKGTCGCRIPGETNGGSPYGLLAALAMFGALGRRRRTRATARRQA